LFACKDTERKKLSKFRGGAFWLLCVEVVEVESHQLRVLYAVKIEGGAFWLLSVARLNVNIALQRKNRTF